MSANIEINNTEVFDDEAVLTINFENSACTVDAIDGLTIQFEITATNKSGEEKDFTVAFQNTERNNGMMAYSGYEVSEATQYGYDADESEDLEIFMDYEESFIIELKNTAKNLSKEKLNEMLLEKK